MGHIKKGVSFFILLKIKGFIFVQLKIFLRIYRYSLELGLQANSNKSANWYTLLSGGKVTRQFFYLYLHTKRFIIKYI